MCGRMAVDRAGRWTANAGARARDVRRRRRGAGAACHGCIAALRCSRACMGVVDRDQADDARIAIAQIAMISVRCRRSPARRGFAFFWVIWGSPSPIAPYGADTSTSASYILRGLIGLLVDQQFGVDHDRAGLLVDREPITSDGGTFDRGSRSRSVAGRGSVRDRGCVVRDVVGGPQLRRASWSRFCRWPRCRLRSLAIKHVPVDLADPR